MGIEYVTHRQEPERQTVAEDVTDSLSAASGFCQLCVTDSFSLCTHPLTSVALCHLVAPSLQPPTILISPSSATVTQLHNYIW